MTLRLGTFNVWGLPETFGIGDDCSSRMRLIAERLSRSELDVLFIQEAWTDEVRGTLREGADAAGFAVADGPGASGGLMTLTRLPIVKSRFERFRFRGDPERVAQGEFLGGKGFQDIVLETPEGPLAVVNTHLHARYRRARPELNSAVRTAQLLQIVRHLSETEGTVVIGGDFNCSVGELEYEVFRGLARAIELGGGSEHSTLSKLNYYKRHRTGQDKRIDFLFVRPGPGAAWQTSGARLLFAEPARIRKIDRSLSDHFGFRAELTLAEVVSPFAPSSQIPPDPKALDLAHRLLDIGTHEASRREESHRNAALSFTSLALLAAGARYAEPVDRRRFLRFGATAAVGVAAIPAAGYGALALLDADKKRDAFSEARGVLARLAAKESERRA